MSKCDFNKVAKLQNRRGTENFDICFCVVLITFSKALYLERRLGTRLCLTNFEIFQLFLNYPTYFYFIRF